MDREAKTARLLRRAEFWSFAIFALGVVWFAAEVWSAFHD